MSGNHRSMFTNKFKFTFKSRHIITQVFKHISIVFQLSTNISIEVFLFNNKIIKLIRALTSRLITTDSTFIKSIERIYLYYLCRVIKAMYSLQKKDTSATFWAEQKKICHTYDTSMMIIVTKPGIIIDVVGSYFYDKKS